MNMIKKTAQTLKRKRLNGKVVSSEMKDTAVVSVSQYYKHPRYRKYIRKQKRFMVQDRGNSTAVGEDVVIEETRPVSKNKCFKIVKR